MADLYRKWSLTISKTMQEPSSLYHDRVQLSPQSATIPSGIALPSVRVIRIVASSTFSAHPESWKNQKQ